ncbi:hypothetical protein E2C01_035719 [Portunus trituberculatus]|uniref:Uncharacterized protein n=1 Tax=Portunus trituberculatus TaxID=210409 RepID=A0A5B7F940_PORTR|nr:hypothetical protein [Portunus trituberculatus]
MLKFFIISLPFLPPLSRHSSRLFGARHRYTRRSLLHASGTRQSAVSYAAPPRPPYPSKNLQYAEARKVISLLGPCDTCHLLHQQDGTKRGILRRRHHVVPPPRRLSLCRHLVRENDVVFSSARASQSTGLVFQACPVVWPAFSYNLGSHETHLKLFIAISLQLGTREMGGERLDWVGLGSAWLGKAETGRVR